MAMLLMLSQFTREYLSVCGGPNEDIEMKTIHNIIEWQCSLNFLET